MNYQEYRRQLIEAMESKEYMDGDYGEPVAYKCREVAEIPPECYPTDWPADQVRYAISAHMAGGEQTCACLLDNGMIGIMDGGMTNWQ